MSRAIQSSSKRGASGLRRRASVCPLAVTRPLPSRSLRSPESWTRSKSLAVRSNHTCGRSRSECSPASAVRAAGTSSPRPRLNDVHRRAQRRSSTTSPEFTSSASDRETSRCLAPRERWAHRDRDLEHPTGNARPRCSSTGSSWFPAATCFAATRAPVRYWSNVAWRSMTWLLRPALRASRFTRVRTRPRRNTRS